MTKNARKHVFQIDEEACGVRLDSFISRQFLQVSRVILRHAIASGQVLVNDFQRRSSYKLRSGDIIQVEVSPLPTAALVPEPIPIKVVFEDSHILIIDKPAGLVVHPNRQVTSGTLMNALCHHLQQSDPGARPGLIHRLDKHTSGLMVVAKTEQAHRVLAKHFRQRMVTKKYLALVHGEVSSDSVDINLPLGWVNDAYPHWQVKPAGREALTSLRVLERFRGFTLIEAEPKTGRTHQIRIHLAAIGHPLVGDSIYGKKQLENLRLLTQSIGIALDRHFLHASYLEFKHPRTGEPRTFSSPLPEDLKNLIERIRICVYPVQ
ncbi:MAG: RluA family pseudouridine synthase [Acidobacteria bacterium]|nr:RluA family pseudouridine synthase [Acidobacteriota bacterium]